MQLKTVSWIFLIKKCFFLFNDTLSMETVILSWIHWGTIIWNFVWHATKLLTKNKKRRNEICDGLRFVIQLRFDTVLIVSSIYWAVLFLPPVKQNILKPRKKQQIPWHRHTQDNSTFNWLITRIQWLPVTWGLSTIENRKCMTSTDCRHDKSI